MAFEAFLAQKQSRARRAMWRRATVVLSLGLHGALLMAAVVYSFTRVEEVTPPAVFVTFHGGRAAAPPPRVREIPAEPPKPTVEAARTERPKVAAAEPPREPTNDKPPPPSSDTAASGEPGTQRGAPAGVLGETGVAVFATVAPPPPRESEPQPVTLPPGIATGQRITDITDPRFRPSLPGTFNRAGVMLWGLFRICVGADGGVKNVKVLKTAGPTVDGDWVRVIYTWRYQPYAIDGQPTPFCHTMRLEVRGAS